MKAGSLPKLVFVTCIGCLEPMASATVAQAQTITTEGAVSAGVSSDNVSAVATQLRAFGEVRGGIRYFVEGAWADASAGNSDAFGAAYPYGNRVQVIEAYGERIFLLRGMLVGIQAGRFRTPFGISSGSDHAYTGFLRAPLVRYDGYFALSNDFLEHGADIVVGVPQLTVEATVGAPADVGKASRRSDVDTIVRVQSSAGPFIVGASYIRTSPYQTGSFVQGRSEFSGIDLRWMQGGVQLRGEWLTGRPFDGTTTTGWYTDAIVHRVAMGRVTAVARLERLDYDVRHPFDLHTRRETIGARVRLVEGLSAQVNMLQQTGQLAGFKPRALDLGVTYSLRMPRD
jgi:hypothetical protein